MPPRTVARLLIPAACFVAGMFGIGWLADRLLGRVITELSTAVGLVSREVAQATGSAIGAGVAGSVWVEPEPSEEDHLARAAQIVAAMEQDAGRHHAFDPTLNLLPDPDRPTAVVIAPGESLIPGDV